jgi:hypothetical protein
LQAVGEVLLQIVPIGTCKALPFRMREVNELVVKQFEDVLDTLVGVVRLRHAVGVGSFMSFLPKLLRPDEDACIENKSGSPRRIWKKTKTTSTVLLVRDQFEERMA